MTDPYDEIRALRARIADLEARLAPEPEGGTTMYRTREDETGEQRRVRELAEMWRFDPTMERLAQLVEQGTHDAMISPAMRMSLGFYKQAKAAAKAAGRDVSGSTGVERDHPDTVGVGACWEVHDDDRGRAVEALAGATPARQGDAGALGGAEAARCPPVGFPGG